MFLTKLGNTNKCYPPLCGNISKLSSLDTPRPLLFDLCSSIYLEAFLLSGRRVVHLVLPAQCLWPSLGDLILSPVRWKGSLTWNQMLLRLLFDPLHTHSHTLGTVSSCPSTQKSYLHNPEKKILSWLEPARNIVAHPLPQRGARMPEGSIFFCHVDVSFLIYRIFLM